MASDNSVTLLVGSIIGGAVTVAAAWLNGKFANLNSKVSKDAQTETAQITTQATAKSAQITAETNQGTEALKLFAAQLDSVNARSLALETNLRTEMAGLRTENQRLSNEINALTLKFTQSENDHLHKQREWDTQCALQEQQITTLTEEVKSKDGRIATLLRHETSLIELLDKNIGTDWRGQEVEWIGVPTTEAKDRFRDRMLHIAKNAEHVGGTEEER